MMLEQIPGTTRVPVGGDKGFDAFGFVAECRNLQVVPPVAQNLGRRAGARLTGGRRIIPAIVSVRRRGSGSKNVSAG